MATPFSRTIRSLQNDSNLISIAGLLIAILLTIIWFYWFFTAPIISYEVSQEVYVTDQRDTISWFPSRSAGARRVKTLQRRIIVAKFPAEVMKRIQLDQLALLRLDGKMGKQIGPIPAKVVKVIDSLGTEPGTVELRTEMAADKPDPLEEGQSGKVIIEVENVTPARLILRASGLFATTPPLSVSPQPR